ncbi:TetR/AcrR family transcriptional regulator [Shewanella gaetbuli]|uniref:TetR/AcrR family transcriptional regulator n=1 Tax=Shewanella gaetbuli TaxID=220752 RepID=A0A9X1ZLJ6_9GAMM|nr:TetR/AcrR family transcriptional regulator [Shewanella gaetbuli]MCL1141892.1 TetR/AcrR family transcriptional regulator [Shewanella gaetbuli]
MKQGVNSTPKDKKQAILDCALHLFVDQGFHATSTASIAKKSAVATGTLFHHFPSKQHLINQLFLNIKQEFAYAISQNRLMTNNIEHSANDLWQKAIDWAIENPYKQKFFLQFSLSAEIDQHTRQQAMNDILHFVVDLIKQGQQQGFIVDTPLDLLLENFHGQYLAAIRFFTDNPELGQNSLYRQASFKLVWQAIRAN